MKNSKVYDRPIKPFPEYVQKDITYKLHTLLLALLRPTITPSILQPNILNLSEEDWTRLFTLAAQHGVTALLFDTILRLPEQQQPSRALKIRWALSSEAIEKRHAQQTRAAHELTTLFASHGVRTILLKGLGLSIYYPRPEHRECGDIDLWLDNCDKGNRLIEELGIKINYDSEKHAVFHYKGVMVENHSHLLMPSHRRTERAIDDFLVGEAENSRLAPAGYYTPSPMFNALYLLRHMARHFGTEGINLRHLLDWGLFLRSEQSEIDFEKILTLYAATGYDTVYNIFTALAGELLDEDFTPLLSAVPDPQLKQRVLNDILGFGVYRTPSGNRLTRIGRKTRKLFSCRWKYRTLLPENFWRDVILPSLLFHLKIRKYLNRSIPHAIGRAEPHLDCRGRVFPYLHEGHLQPPVEKVRSFRFSVRQGGSL